jgi:hypothetical protein
MPTFKRRVEPNSVRRMTRRVFTPPKKQLTDLNESHADLEMVNRLIEKESGKLTEKFDQQREEEKELLTPVVVDTPAEFNGTDTDERFQLLQAELQNEQKKTAKLLHEVNLVKQEFDQEKQRLEQHIRDLKRELHQNAPTTDHNFFSISNDLKEAVNLIDKLVQTSPTPVTAATPIIAAPEPKIEAIKLEPPKLEPPAPEPPKPEPVKPEEPVKESKPPNKKKKLMITGGVAMVILIAGSAIITSGIMKPKVDQTLVKEYLTKNGQVQGATDTSTIQKPVDTGTAQDNSQKDFTLEQTVWTELKEPIFGIKVTYPQNVIKLTHSESNITFLRKEGYIFRVQKVETGLEPAEYWKQIKATNLNYSDSEVDFKGKKAIYLQLEEMTKYPGDRYLVKIGKVIYDVWYATPSNSFSKDDVERAKKMLDSLEFITANGSDEKPKS